jgi:Molybdopterin-binding domain of aldehyde dehydrogenase
VRAGRRERAEVIGCVKTQLTILVLVGATLLNASCREDAAPARTPTVVWRTLGSWSGRGSMQTEPFISDTVADVGTVIHPRNLGGQILGGVMLGLGHAYGQHWVYDQQYGLPLAKRFYNSKPATILDAPAHMQWAALDLPDPETPVGARGVGESPVGAGFGAIVNAIAAALGDEIFRRAPVTADKILMALEAGRPMHEALTANV